MSLNVLTAPGSGMPHDFSMLGIQHRSNNWATGALRARMSASRKKERKPRSVAKYQCTGVFEISFGPVST